ESQNIFIDGVLKQDTGNNDLSRDSAKTHLKGHKEISVIYAYSHDMQEVICSKAYQGNMLDSKAFRDFIKSNNVTKGVLVCDKGFPVSKIRDLLEQYPDLHYISPYRRNAKV
ncbi:transposase, partial [Anaerobiospirillum succiniciproducens]